MKNFQSEFNDGDLFFDVRIGKELKLLNQSKFSDEDNRIWDVEINGSLLLDSHLFTSLPFTRMDDMFNKLTNSGRFVKVLNEKHLFTLRLSVK